MLDPFTVYSRMIAAAFGMADTAQRTGETLVASSDVISRRTQMMGAAARSPIDGNYTELGRMVPEKIEAFSQAGAAMASDWWVIQSALMSELQRMAKMAMSGRPPSLAEWSALSSRNASLAMRTFERVSAMSGKGLRPIHATATSNARRLK
jgi:hypothetical protein